MKLPTKVRFSIAGMLAAVLVVGLLLAWVRVQLNQHASFEDSLRAKLEKPNTSVFTAYSYHLPRRRLFGFFETGRNVNQLCEIGLGGGITDDDLLVLDQIPNLEKIQLYDTKVTDAGLMHLTRHARLASLDITGRSVTTEGVAAFQRARPTVRVTYQR
jgi:hypothetical protein